MKDLVILAIVALVAVLALVISSGVTGAPIYSDPCQESGLTWGKVVDGTTVQAQEDSGKRCFTVPGFGDQYCCVPM